MNRGMAEWVRENVLLRMLSARNASLVALERTQAARNSYIPDKLPANIDAMLGVIDQSPVLSEQIRFRHV